MNRVAILSTVGRCVTCGRVACASPRCFRAALAPHAAHSVLLQRLVPAR